MVLARDLARYAASITFDDLPAEVVHEAKRALLDTLGCAIGGYSSDASTIVQRLVYELRGRREATVFGSGLKTSCLYALLANGVMVRFLDYNDTYAVPVGTELSGGHPSEIIPAILALGERQRSTGRDVITAMVVGYELSARFIDAAVNPGAPAPTMEAKGWNADTRGIFVMPVVAARLLGLNEEETVNAIGISGSHNMILGILDAAGEPYTMTKNLRFARTAHGGVLAALLAQQGFTGPPRVLEGNKGFVQAVMRGEFNPDALTAPRQRFAILDTIYKAVAADATTHGHVTATLQLVNAHDIRPDEVAQVTVTAGSRCIEHTGDPVKRYPTNKESADHSSYYLTAIAILERRVGPEQYTPERFNDPRVRALIDKVTLVADPALDGFGRAGITEIRTHQGATYRQRVDYPRGDPRQPMSDQELEDKFRHMAAAFMPETQIRKVIDTVYDLERLKDVRRLMKTMVFP